ncbi:hypothetical protein [Scytonema sp. NUACC26]|uniref:hypothetical protein n=1 Tax=Scytonema sp. NUACC26 TaxID=3140176 RepID=UPI0034DBC01C
MSYKNTCELRKKYRDLKELCEQNLWWDGGNKKDSCMKKEIFQELKQPVQKEESEFTRNKPLVLFVLGIVALLSIAVLSRAEEISHGLVEIRKNSIHQLLLMKNEE